MQELHQPEALGHVLLPLLLVAVAAGGCQGELTNPTGQVEPLEMCSRVAESHAWMQCDTKRVVHEQANMLAFASVFSLLYFLPEALSTILSRQGLITCCGVSTILAGEPHF